MNGYPGTYALWCGPYRLAKLTEGIMAIKARFDAQRRELPEWAQTDMEHLMDLAIEAIEELGK